MGSLFTRIFLTFWVVALVLGVALFGAGRYLRGEAVQAARTDLAAHAQTAAALEQDRGAQRRWLERLWHTQDRPFWLLDAEGRHLAGRPLPPPLAERFRSEPPEAGRFSGPRRNVLLVAAVPGEEPPERYLATLVHPEAGHGLSPLLFLGGAAGASGLAAWLIAALLTRRLGRLRRGAQALGDGDLSVRVELPGRDEVAALARDFDRMADRLGGLLDGQRRLLRDLSHQLRSPLARLRLALEMARSGGHPGPALDRMEREAEHLDALVGEILTLARLESGQAELERTPVDLAALVAAVARDGDFEAREAGKAVHWRVPDAVTVTGERTLLRAAVENVVRNAIRHTPPGTAVSVTLEVVGEEAAVRITDEGPGMAEAETARLLEPFSRGAEAEDQAGFGLGLAVTRRVIESHRGRLEVANRGRGGLSVVLRLPRANPAG
ncbi:MAG: ATP-binding protein [Thiohalospira sp.]